MKVSTMRRVDHHVGVVVCFVLTAFRRCIDLLKKVWKSQPEAKAVKHEAYQMYDRPEIKNSFFFQDSRKWTY